jgi:AAA ATPase containing von Willebrand factor type A (vWA) domain
MTELQTEIVDINDEALEALFNDTPEKTVSADTLIGGKEPENKDKEKPPVTTKTPHVERFDTIEDIDFDDEDEPTEDDEDNEDEDEKKTVKAKEKVEKVEDDSAKEKEDVVPILKSTVDYLIEQGLWQDFDGREDMEFTEEVYAKLATEQDKIRVQGMFEELVDSTGPFGKAIIDYVKNGGNPDEIIDLFKEQKSMESISIDELDGQKSLVRQYYTSVMGWKSEKADKYISNLVLSNDLETEAQEVKELYSNFYAKEAQKLNEEREAFAIKQKEAEQAFESNIRGTIKERKDLSATEKRNVEDYLLNYDQKLPNGNMVNKFYVNFAKMQANPQDYVDLVMYVMDKQKFVQKIAKTEESKATAKAFSFIKGNSAVSGKKGTTYDSIKKNEKVTSFNWGIPSKG